MVELCTCFTWKTHSFSANQKRTIFFRQIIITKTNNGIEKKSIQAKGTFCGVQQSCWQSVPSFPPLQPDDRRLLMKFSLSAEDCIKYFSWVTISQNFRYLTNSITKKPKWERAYSVFSFSRADQAILLSDNSNSRFVLQTYRKTSRSPCVIQLV